MYKKEPQMNKADLKEVSEGKKLGAMPHLKLYNKQDLLSLTRLRRFETKLGNALIKSGDYAGAREAFQSDLRNNNENGWALFGLWQAFLGEKRKAEAAKTMERFKTAFAKSDIQLHGAVY